MPQCRFSVTHEDELVVVIPPVLFGIRARLLVDAGNAGRAGAAAAHHAETGLTQHVERLLQKRVLQEETSRVAVHVASVRVARLVQRFAECLATERHAAADQDARQLTELDVGETVPAEGERAAIGDGDGAGGALCGHPGPAGCRSCRPQRLGQLGQLKELGLGQQSVALLEALGQHRLLRAQEVEHVAEEHAVSVDEEASATVLRRRLDLPGEEARQQRARAGGECSQRGGVAHAADVQVDDLREGRHGGGRPVRGAAADCRRGRPLETGTDGRTADGGGAPSPIDEGCEDRRVVLPHPPDRPSPGDQRTFPAKMGPGGSDPRHRSTTGHIRSAEGGSGRRWDVVSTTGDNVQTKRRENEEAEEGANS